MTTAITPTQNTDLPSILDDIAGQLAPNSRRAYVADTTHFVLWLQAQGLGIEGVTRSIFIAYRRHLAEDPQESGRPYQKNTAARMLTSARRICQEAYRRGVLPNDPTGDVRGFKSGTQETPYHALTKAEGRALLDAVDRSTAKGKRDYALLLLLIRTGIRRSEAVGLRLCDLGREAGHPIATIQHGKGGVRRTLKLPNVVMHAIEEYIAATGRMGLAEDKPIFVRFWKGDKPSKNAMSGEAVEIVVKEYARAAGIVRLSPHGLRATFVTLALEGGARLDQVQYAVGHADPRTTERYQKRKINLDNHAVDHVHL